MPHPEKSPLLSSTPTSEFIPPFRAPSSLAYGVVEVEASPNVSRRPNQGGIASVPFIAIIAVVIAMVLIFGITTLTTSDGNGRILKQSVASYVDINIPQGDLRGYHRKSRQDRDFMAFYKVPYAAPPLGKLRLRDPEPAQGWEGLRDIQKVGIQCIQKEKYSDVEIAYGEEDCLYANIYIPGLSPAEHSSNLLPTMVYIHGGGFTDGNGSRYGPDYFMDEDAVVVTFQFRLGPLGFLNTEDGVIRGNMGLKDQVQMLKWVRDNIENFGGDPNRVTIYGNSGGGMAVSYLMISPLASGLFHRAITQSGPGLCGGLGDQIDSDPRITVEEVGRVLNCPTEDSQRFLECLEGKDASDIVLVRTPPTKYGLTIERTNDSSVFMPRRPYEMLQVGWVNMVPYVLGVVNSEWAGQALDVLYNPEMVADLNRDFSGTAGSAMNFNMTKEELEDMKALYFGDKEIGNDTIREMAYLISDRGLIHCSFTGAKLHGKYAPTFLYHITKPPYLSYMEKSYPGFPAKELGMVSHADELQYFFLYDGYPEIPNGDQEYFEFSKYLVKLWANFATTGDPTMDGNTWSRMDTDPTSPFWFELGDKTGRTDALQERMAFWDRFSHESLHYV